MYYKALKKIVLLSLILTLSGCALLSGGTPVVETKVVEVPIPITHPTPPRKLDLREPQWYVVSDKNIDEFLEQVEKENAGQVVFVAMSIADYELMAYNMQEIKRYIKQTKEVLLYYRSLNQEEKENERSPK